MEITGIEEVEAVSAVDLDVAGNSEIITTVADDLEIKAVRRVYTLVNDDVYIPTGNYDDAPQWVKDLVTATVNFEVDVRDNSILSNVDSILSLFETGFVPKNEYDNFVVSQQTENSSLNAKFESLNSSMDTLTGTVTSEIQRVDQTYITEDRASTLVGEYIEASITDEAGVGTIGSKIADLSQTVAESDATWATNYDVLMSTLGDESENRATAIEYLNTYVGLDENGTATGIGTLDGIINDIQNQIDGSITSWFETGEPTLVNAPANTWTTDTEKTNHIGDMYYDRATGYSYRFAYEDLPDDTPDEGIIYSWIRITDTDITKALADAAQAQETADGKVTTFYQDSAPIAEGEGDIWIDSDDNNKMYRWDGISWQDNSDKRIVANAEAVTQLEADLNDGEGTWLDADNQVTQSLNTSITNGMAEVESKWEYNSVIGINGVYKKSGFGLTTNYTSGSGTETSPYVSEFWVDASRLKFTNSAMTGRTAPFTIDASGTTPQITFNGKVTFSNISDASTYIPTIDSVTDAEANAIAEAESKVNTAKNELEANIILSDKPTPSVKTASELGLTVPSGASVVGESDACGLGCQSDKTYAEALALVEGIGARLPTLQEVLSGVVSGTGCGFDGVYVWTQTKGANGERYVCIGTGTGGSPTYKAIAETDIASIRFVADVQSSISLALNNLTKVEDISWQTEVQDAINDNATTIDGGKIVTNTLYGNRLIGNTVSADKLTSSTGTSTTWTGGGLVSQNFNGSVHGDIGNPTSGFRLSSNAVGDATDPNIYGAYIQGSTIDVLDMKVRAEGYPNNFGRISYYGKNIAVVGRGYSSGFDSRRVCSSSLSGVKVEGWARAQGNTVTASMQYQVNSGSWVNMNTKTLTMMGYLEYAYLNFAEYFNPGIIPATGYVYFRIVITTYGSNPTTSGVLVSISNN